MKCLKIIVGVTYMDRVRNEVPEKYRCSDIHGLSEE